MVVGTLEAVTGADTSGAEMSGVETSGTVIDVGVVAGVVALVVGVVWP